MNRPDPRLIGTAVATRLVQVANATGYYGQIGRPLPGQKLVAQGGTIPADPPPKSDKDLRVQPYFVLFASGPGEAPDDDAAGQLLAATYRFSITAAGGDVDDVLALTGRIENTLHGWTPTVTGVVCGRVRHPLGYVPSSILTDHSVQPPRLYTAIPFEVVATT